MSQIKLTADSGGGTTSIKAPSSTTSNADVVLKLPVADGSANQVLKTDGSGQLSFTSNAGTTINNNADNRIITGSGTASTLNGESALTFDGSLLKLQVDSGELRVEAANGVDAFSVDSDNGNSFIAGKLGIGTGASTHQCASGGLDLRSVGAVNKGALFIGADSGQNSMSRSSNTEKQFRIMMPSYADPDNGITVLYGEAGNNEQLINYGGATGWAYAINGHRFYVASNTTTATGSLKATIDSDGLKFNGDTSSANALNDYEEGSWTPSLYNSGGLTVHSASYTKIGQLCNISAYVTISSNSNSSALRFNSLPFTAANVGYSIGSAYTQSTGGTHVFTQIDGNSTNITVYKNDGSTIYQSDVSGSYVLFSGTYRTT